MVLSTLLFRKRMLARYLSLRFDDAVTSLKQQLKVEPNTLLRKNHLFELFRNTAYLSSRAVCGADSSDPEELAHKTEMRLRQILTEGEAVNIPADPLFKLAGFATFCDFPTYRPCRCLVESSDGGLLGTAGVGGALHVIPTVEANTDTMSRKPNWQVTTRLHGHTDDVTAIDFHPRRNIIASGGVGMNIILHDINSSNGFVNSTSEIQRLTDSFPIRCLKFHPCGDFLYVGTDNSIIRLYDIATRTCFTAKHTRRQHQGGAINSCDVLRSGGLLFTAGEDGSVLMWDGRNLDVLHALADAHGGAPVLSVNCERYGRYLTSSGKDGSTKITDLRMMRELACVGHMNRGVIRTVSNFMCNTRYVATYSVIQSGRRTSNEVLVYCVDTGSQEIDISKIMGRSSILGICASQHDMALYLLADDSNCKVVSIFDPSA
ncbi:Cleavage stimulation factor subunit 1 [Babesia sp. Xinjiang]|uniref:Cleavage stimulation factor subunit 1 n=1 Tax=Babesia sp. Xinjiang TaxID=462227 RepID=UPI000A21FA09|nr:Cleavage stimulation factor subunit 1 [Babesia sp. Xinjiang]XP_028871490.1 Cleavage stimulation factor subunit 1 [Babesia sp. Xinjiang]ORM40916.1 Cleavage stimulation factor subunit 1 [Babesia sp. Xinjiang]ORM41034.1 Cleavage stimulation factor subunit 1 [Babesia sp. Xinjiang]